MQKGLGDPQMTISLPNAGETLGLQFSVFGPCSEITPTNNPTMTVTVMDGQSQVASATAVNNQQNGAYEASFNLPPGTNIQGSGSVVVTCSAMNGNVTNGQLTICGQTILTIGAPQQGAPQQVAGFPSWSAGVVAKGQVVGCAGKTFWLRLTDAGFDIIGHHSWQIGNDTAWECDLGRLVAAAGRAASKSRHYNIHVSVWDRDAPGERVRVSSGFFSVGT
jgi:hypothetical protein